MSEYHDIFIRRGLSYHAAMCRYPQARNSEFTHLFSKIDFSTVKSVADIPAGGGYLKPFLPADCTLDYFEPCDTFQSSNSKTFIDLEQPDLTDNAYDLIVNLAAIHHIKNKQQFISALFNALKPQGYLCIADVVQDSAIAYFLDNIAGKYNGTGHQGDYLTNQTISTINFSSKYTLLENKIKNCAWAFETEEFLVDFCRLLFGIKTISDSDLLTALNEKIGVDYKNNKVYLRWELIYIALQKI